MEKAAILEEDAGLWGRMLDDYSMAGALIPCLGSIMHIRVTIN
jgi:hypothetical protein